MAPVTERPTAEFCGEDCFESFTAAADSRRSQHPPAQRNRTGRSPGVDIRATKLGGVERQIGVNRQGVGVEGHVSFTRPEGGIEGLEKVEVETPDVMVKGLDIDNDERTGGVKKQAGVKGMPDEELGARRMPETALVVTDMDFCSLCLHEREKVNFTTRLGPRPRASNHSNIVCRCQHQPLTTTTTTTTATIRDNDDDWDWDDDSGVDGVGEDDEEDFVISRSALPKGSTLFERVLDEVAPEVRATEDSFVKFSCPRQRSFTNGMDLETQDSANDAAKSAKRRISWADQRGFPLKSELVFEH